MTFSQIYSALGKAATPSGLKKTAKLLSGPRVSSAASAATLSPDKSAFDIYRLTALAGALTVNTPTGMKDGDELVFEIASSGPAARALTWPASFKGTGGGVAILATTPATPAQCIFNFLYVSATGNWIITNTQ